MQLFKISGEIIYSLVDGGHAKGGSDQIKGHGGALGTGGIGAGQLVYVLEAGGEDFGVGVVLVNAVADLCDGIVRVGGVVLHAVVVHGNVFGAGQHCEDALHGGIDSRGSYGHALGGEGFDGADTCRADGNFDAYVAAETAQDFVGFLDDGLRFGGNDLHVQGLVRAEQLLDFGKAGIYVNIALLFQNARVGGNAADGPVGKAVANFVEVCGIKHQFHNILLWGMKRV